MRYLLLPVFFLISFVAQAQISSTFNANALGWTTPNDADGTIGYNGTGGNPGGFVFGSPFVINLGAGSLYVPFNFVAPTAYLGNRSTYYNGTLRYDVQQSTTGAPNQYAEVTIANNLGIVLYYFPPTSNQPPAAPSWATYSVVLNNNLGYWKTTNSPTGAAATEVQIQSILTDLATLEIRGLYRDANVTSRLDNVSMTPPIIINTQPTNSTVCSGAITTLTTAASGNPTITYQWEIESSPSVWANVTNTGGYSGATTATLTINTTGNFGAGNYRCRISGINVVDAITNSATLTINFTAAPTTTGASRCGTGTVTLSAAGGAAGQYRWYTVPTGGTAIAGQTNNTYTTPSIAATTTYYVAINNGTCESTRTAVTATINTIPAAPTTTAASRCGTGTVTLTAAGGAAGQYRWYTVPTGGTAIAGQTNSTYTTPSLAITTTYYVSINNGFCEGTRSPVTATINTIPAAPTTTDAARCGTGTVTLSAAGGAAGQYRWYSVPTGGTAIAGQTNNTYTTPSIAATTTYYVAINNGTCESTRTAVTATINTIPATPTTTNASRCGTGTVTLSAAGGAAGQYRWYTVPTGGTAIAGQTNSTYTTPSLTITTTYYVALNNGLCEGPRATVTATINTIPAAPTTTDAARCGTGTVTLSAAGGAAGQYRWYPVASGGTAITGQTNNTYTTPSLSTTTTYHVAINNGTCESTRTPVIATINTLPTAPTTTGAESCLPGSVTLSASGGTNGQYRWYTVPSGGTALAGETNNAFITPVLSVTTTYYVAINNGPCESTRTPAVATIATPGCDNEPPAIAPVSSATAIGGIITINLVDLISDANDNVDFSTLAIIGQPSSGATATIDANFNLIINYQGIAFTGTENITIQVCDIFAACTQQVLSLEVVGDIDVFNAISPNGDTRNDIFLINHIEKFDDTRENRVSIYNRWGDLVWEGRNYDNLTVYFEGRSKNNTDLPAGTYFFKIEFFSGRPTQVGYLSLKR
ncbi:MAG: gliding motility-associated C-terminal domain-containing protein [Cyclobacteriaceae bacterium]|nr:gliding motility-associated C-terminal domain-containing protein [Cyclobacteriaceae bacterium]